MRSLNNYIFESREISTTSNKQRRKELINSDKDGKDLQEIIDKGTNFWGFKLFGKEEYQKEDIKDLKKYIKELKK